MGCCGLMSTSEPAPSWKDAQAAGSHGFISSPLCPHHTQKGVFKHIPRAHGAHIRGKTMSEWVSERLSAATSNKTGNTPPHPYPLALRHPPRGALIAASIARCPSDAHKVNEKWERARSCIFPLQRLHPLMQPILQDLLGNSLQPSQHCTWSRTLSKGNGSPKQTYGRTTVSVI